MAIGTLPDGTRGFDANARVTAPLARAFHDAGYRFAVRYVRRAKRHGFDLTAREVGDLLGAGLGLMIVQHVAPPGWRPDAALGAAYGAIAAQETQAIGVPGGVTLWCDLEGVAAGVPSADVIGFCNAWYTAARAAGYEPGLYVGDSPGLDADQLYRRLRFRRYWAAYNLNRDQYPAVRGVQMLQRAAKHADLVPGCPFQFDVDLIEADRKGDRPVLLLPHDAPDLPG